MKRASEFLLNHFLDPRAVIFGVAVFNFGWVWSRPPDGEFYKHVFMAALLLASSVLILIKRVWSNLLAAVLSGYLPVQFAYEFWMLARHAEVPAFSLRHLAVFAGEIVGVGGAVVFFICLSAMILAYSAYSMQRIASGHVTPNGA